jgi:hypothetical protein
MSRHAFAARRYSTADGEFAVPKRTQLFKTIYENVIARWQKLGLSGEPPVISRHMNWR